MSNLKLVNVMDEFTTSTGKRVQYYSLPNLQKALGSGANISRLPISIRILLESLLRNKDGKAVTDSDIEELATWNASNPADKEIPFRVGRVLMQDLTGVPALVDLAAMRDAAVSLKLDPMVIEPEVPIDLVIDHSIQVDAFRSVDAFRINAEKEIERNRERYKFLKWAQQAFRNLKLVPPDTGIVHQVNLEFLASVVMEKEIEDKKIVAYPDTLVGTDSHTPMINGLGILGWGVGGIEAEAALLGQPVTFVTPKVYGVHLTGSPKDGVTATDVVLTITQKLREIGVVDAFVEFFGDGVKALTVAGRATISNMTPEFGATASLFPVDEETLRYLKLSGRSDSHIELVKKYFEAQGMFGAPAAGQIDYSQVINIDLSEVEASVAGPTLPHERTGLGNVGKHFVESFPSLKESAGRKSKQLSYEGKDYTLSDGDVVIAAITSCTNTSNPSVMIAAGLLAKRAVELGLDVRRIVKTSMAPGSMVVTEYLKAMGLLPYLEKLGFGIVGYGCTTCIAQGTPVLLGNGTTRRIELMPATGGVLLFGPTAQSRLGLAPQSQSIKQGVRDCVSLVLQDGRSLLCTPDHKILCSDGRWVRADELVLGRDRVVVGLEGPLDEPGEDELGYVLSAGNLTLMMDTELNRARMLAFARLLGHLLSDGSISVMGQGRMNVGQALDREMVLNDIELITGLRPVGKRYDEQKWSIVLPMALTKAIIKLPGVQMGRRIGQVPTLPKFVFEDDCPVSVVREFLGGLFGADGHGPALHRWSQFEEDSTIEPPAYSNTTIPEHVRQLKKVMRDMIRLLARCGVKTEGAQVYEFPTRRAATSYAMSRDGITRIEVRLALPDGISFVEHVGFRYSVDKAMKASAAAVYWRLVDGINIQRLWMARRLVELHRNQPELSFSRARQIVATTLLDYNVEDPVPPVVSPHYALLEGCDRFSRLPQAVDRKFQPLHRKSCDFPSPVELFKELGVRDWFAPLRSRAETEHFHRYCVEKEAMTLPTFSLCVVDRRPAGQRLVYDLSVPDLHAFMAGTVAVHNCIGNSGPLPEPVGNAIRDNQLTTAAVLSGNRNFEARIHQDVRANFLMSPPLVVAYALAGTVMKDLTKEPLGIDADGHPVYLRDIWPSDKQVLEYQTKISTEMFRSRYAQVYNQNSEWNKLDAPTGVEYKWDQKSTYIQQPPYFIDYEKKLAKGEKKIFDISGARPLLILGDYVTTDHISPAGAFSSKSVAGKYLLSKGVTEEEFNTYGSRRGNHLVMIRGTFANPRIKNIILGGTEGALTKHFPDGEVLPIFDASLKYQGEKIPLVVIAGKGFGTGSSRDWAAKGQKLLGVRAVIAESFERIHRSNLVGMGILPLQFKHGISSKTLGLDGSELYDISGIKEAMQNGSSAKLTITRKDGRKMATELIVRIDSEVEKEYFVSGGILDYVLGKKVSKK
ncbi:MAG TPA: aconitate hydratase AcnA [Nitrososphaerales archaeon]|nr:aconitate hydratase AcnA [Nitrososphaerales archaeon]